jgi:hypothetical protein
MGRIQHDARRRGSSATSGPVAVSWHRCEWVLSAPNHPRCPCALAEGHAALDDVLRKRKVPKDAVRVKVHVE